MNGRARTTTMMITFVLMGVFSAVSASAKLNSVWSYTFGNGTRVSYSWKFKRFRPVRQMNFTNGDSTFTITKGKNLHLFTQIIDGSVDSVQAQSDLLLAQGDQRNYLVDREGHVIPTRIPTQGLVSWSARWMTVGQESYVLTTHHTQDQTETYLVRPEDGASLKLDHPDDPVTVPFEKDGRFYVPPIEDKNVGSIPLTQELTNSQKLNEHPGVARLSQLSQVGDIEQLLESRLGRRVFGQKTLLHNMSVAFAKTLMTKMTRPFAAVMTGPTGVGKSLLGRALARVVFQSDDYFLELDGNDFKSPIEGGHAEHHRLFGAPLGQKGQQKGLISEWIRRTGGDGVLLINEADKMHPDVWMRLMEFIDTGRTVDGAGREIKARNLYILFTSNRGSRKLFPDTIKGWTASELKAYVESLSSEKVKNAYLQPDGPNDKFQLPPEVLERFDAFWTATPLDQEGAVEIVRSVANGFIAEATERYDVRLRIHDDVIRHFALFDFTNSKNGRAMGRLTVGALKSVLEQAAAHWKVPKGATFDVTLDKIGDTPQLTVHNADQSFQLPAPRLPEENPLRDPHIVDVVLNLERVLNERVIGQPEMIAKIAPKLVAQYSDQFRKRAVSIFIVGPTGVGKTETGRAIAEYRYGSSDHVQIIDFGKVAKDEDFNEIFGVPAGVEGWKEVRAFERALMAMPNGGVIVCDEVSNMGGNDKSRKDAFFKRLYNITEERFWTSPTNPSVKYDLSKYTIEFTGNDGQHITQNMTSDDQRLSEYNANKSEEKVQRMLEENGVPSAFLGRMAGTALAKPLLRSEIGNLVHNVLDKHKKLWSAQHRGASFNYDAHFEHDLGEIFYLSDRGGRSLRTLVEDTMTALISQVLIKAGCYPAGDTNVDITLKVSDNHSNRPYVYPNAPQRVAKLQAEVRRNGKLISDSFIDATDVANYFRVADVKSAKKSLAHEIGHGLLNDPKITGEALGFITIFGGRSGDLEYMGYARYEPVPNVTVIANYETTIAKIAQLTAGRVAQQMAGFEADGGWTNDLEKIRKLIADYNLKWGLAPELTSLPLNKEGEPIMSTNQRALYDQLSQKMQDEGERIAREFLIQRWSLARALMAEGLLKGTISGARFKEIESHVMAEGPLRKNSKYRSNFYDFVQEEFRRQDSRQAKLNRIAAGAAGAGTRSAAGAGTTSAAGAAQGSTPTCASLLQDLINQGRPNPTRLNRLPGIKL